MTINSTPRHDGFTPARQVAFLENLAATGMVRHAVKAAGMSHEAAYNLRHRAEGAAFRVGCDAALLMARARLADALMERAIEGQEELVVRDADAGTRTRHRHDNRLALSLLARLDRLASDTPPSIAPGVETPGHAAHADARIVTGAWDSLIALVETGGDGAALTAFLDANRPPPPPVENAPGPCQLCAGDFEGEPYEASETDLRDTFMVWRDEGGRYRTNFPPPPGFAGEETGVSGHGDPDWKQYSRSLTPREAVYEAAIQAASDGQTRAKADAWRREWFGIDEGEDEIGTPGKTLTITGLLDDGGEITREMVEPD
ncbi:MAG: hypothetical protein V4530_08390 [Pseudomonadota bacterium]